MISQMLEPEPRLDRPLALGDGIRILEAERMALVQVSVLDPQGRDRAATHRGAREGQPPEELPPHSFLAFSTSSADGGRGPNGSSASIPPDPCMTISPCISFACPPCASSPRSPGNSSYSA